MTGAILTRAEWYDAVRRIMPATIEASTNDDANALGMHDAALRALVADLTDECREFLEEFWLQPEAYEDCKKLLARAKAAVSP